MHDDQAHSASLTAEPVVTVPLVGPDRVLHSDPHDFAGLYLRHRSSFTLHARRYLRDARDADEVVQEAFLRLFLALPELETELQALAYCRRTITNLCIDRYRAQARRPRLVDLDSVAVEDLADDDPGDPVVRAEDAAIVRDALSMLSPLHRAALVKREIEEKPLPVIAEELDIAEDSVKHVLFRARRALRRLLATTSLAPGRDGEGSVGLGIARAGSGGLAALLLLAVLGLGSGPNLKAIPVVGADLPDLPGVTEIAKVVGDAVTGVSRAVTAKVGSAGASAGSGSALGDGPGGAAGPAPMLDDATSSAPLAPQIDRNASAPVTDVLTPATSAAAKPTVPVPPQPAAAVPVAPTDATGQPPVPEPSRTTGPGSTVVPGGAAGEAAPGPSEGPGRSSGAAPGDPTLQPREPAEAAQPGTSGSGSGTSGQEGTSGSGTTGDAEEAAEEAAEKTAKQAAKLAEKAAKDAARAARDAAKAAQRAVVEPSPLVVAETLAPAPEPLTVAQP